MNEQITITNLLTNPDGSRYGFAVTDAGAGVYIPVGVMALMPIETTIGAKVEAILTENTNDRAGRTPWFCSAIDRPDAEDGSVTAQDILDYINQCDVALTAAHVAEDLGIPSAVASTTLANLHTAEEVARISLYRKQGQTRASTTAYVAQLKAEEIFSNVLGEEE